jgi:hypothetical protein
MNIIKSFIAPTSVDLITTAHFYSHEKYKIPSFAHTLIRSASWGAMGASFSPVGFPTNILCFVYASSKSITDVLITGLALIAFRPNTNNRESPFREGIGMNQLREADPHTKILFVASTLLFTSILQLSLFEIGNFFTTRALQTFNLPTDFFPLNFSDMLRTESALLIMTVAYPIFLDLFYSETLDELNPLIGIKESTHVAQPITGTIHLPRMDE